MPGNEVSLQLDTSQAEAKVERLRQKIAEAKAEAANLGGAPAGGAPAAASGQTGGAAVLTGSVQQGGATAAETVASELAAQGYSRTQIAGWQKAMTASLGGVWGTMAPPAQVAMAQQYMGAPAGTMLPQTPNAATATVGLVQSAQATQVLAVRTAMGGVLPVGYESIGPWAPGQLAAGRALDPTMALSTAQLAAAQGQSPFGPAATTPGFSVGALGAGLAVAGYQALSVSTQQLATGRPDLMGRAAIPGMIAGGIAGSMFGVPGAAVGAMLGGQITQWLAAPAINEQARKEAMYGMTGFFGGDLQGRATWAQLVSSSVTNNGLNWQTMSGQAVAAMGSQAAFGIWMGGGDPFAQTTGGMAGPAPPYPRQERMTGRLIEDLVRQNQNAVRGAQWVHDMWHWRKGGTEQLWQSVTANIATLYPNEDTAQQVMGRVSPILGARPETGDNPVDILARFGPQAAFEYYQATAPGVWRPRLTNRGSDVWSAGWTRDVGLPRFDRDTLRNLSVTMRSAERGIGLASTLARGGPAMTAGILSGEMAAIADMPGGTESLTYHQLGAARRGAVRSAFEEYAGATYELPLARMGGEYERAGMMPFAPGYRYGMGLQMANYRAQYAGAIGRYREQRRHRGELSVEEDLALEQQTQSLLTANQAVIAEMAEGGPNLMASLSTGGPAGWGRFDAMQMAALRVRGTPIRRFGAMGGAQGRGQDDFARSFGANVGPWNPGAGTDPNTAAVVGLLREIRDSLRSGGGSFPLRARGAADLAPGGGYVQSGNAAPFN